MTTPAPVTSLIRSYRRCPRGGCFAGTLDNDIDTFLFCIVFRFRSLTYRNRKYEGCIMYYFDEDIILREIK